MKAKYGIGILIAVAAMTHVAMATTVRPIVIAHRGASGYLPEHTLEAYALAYAMGADYIEQDVVLTKDKHFVCSHDIHLESTTDVEQQFPDRKRKDGRWYAADFTLAEIKQLNVHERLSNRFPVGKAQFRVPTFEEAIELVQGLNKTTGRTVGIYPELKAPLFHKKQGLPMEEAFLEVLSRYGYTKATDPIFVQCFEMPTLKKLRSEFHSSLRTIQLLSDSPIQARMMTQEGLEKIAKYANGIGPNKVSVETNPDLVTWAHQYGLEVHPYTFRRDAVPKKYHQFDEELAQFFTTYKVDGLFTDFADLAANFLRTQDVGLAKK